MTVSSEAVKIEKNREEGVEERTENARQKKNKSPRTLFFAATHSFEKESIANRT